MNRLQVSVAAIALAVCVGVAPGVASAHHSAAMFDHDKITPLTGTVKEFQWKNPHAWIILMAPGASGPMTEWTIECSSINILARKGWTGQSFKAGDKISLTMHPMKDGSAAGFILKTSTADGHSLTDHDY